MARSRSPWVIGVGCVIVVLLVVAEGGVGVGGAFHAGGGCVCMWEMAGRRDGVDGVLSVLSVSD